MRERLEAPGTCKEEPLDGAAPPGQAVLGKGMGSDNCIQCKAEELAHGPLNHPGRTEIHHPAPSLKEVPAGFPGAKKMAEMAYYGSKSPRDRDHESEGINQSVLSINTADSHM